MKTKRNPIQLCLLTAMWLALPATVQAQFTFTTNNGAITITGYTGNPTVLIIPNATNGYPVTSIGTNAFLSRLSLTSVIIPDSVTNIGSLAFDQCSNMTNFTFGGGVKTIGQGAFIQCLGLTSVTIPNNVINIGNQAFSLCNNLTNFSIGSGVTTIGSLAFNQCNNLKSITIPNNVTNLGSQAFQNCSLLSSITIGSPSIVSSWVGGIKTITSITLLDSVTNIGIYAFSSCTSLTNVAIGSGLASIGASAFLGCTALLAITVAPNNPAYKSVGGVLFDASQSTLIQYPLALGASSYTVPNSVTNIGGGAFEGCFYLTRIYFLGNAPSSGASAFAYDGATIYYLLGTTGWGATFGGLRAVLWNPQAQNDGSFGVQTNQFGFNLTGSSNLVIVVEACTNLVAPIWSPVGTNTLNTFVGTNGTSYFSDPQWTNYPGRYYRLRAP